MENFVVLFTHLVYRHNNHGELEISLFVKDFWTSCVVYTSDSVQISPTIPYIVPYVRNNEILFSKWHMKHELILVDVYNLR